MKMLPKSYFLCNILRFNMQVQHVRNSALFLNGAKATETFAYITPHIDFEEKIKQKTTIQDHLLRRKSNFNLQKLEDLWAVYKELETRKLEYEKFKGNISRELGILIKSKPDDLEVEKHKLRIKLIKDNIRKLKEPLWSAEEAAVVEFLKLPNALHPHTPDSEKVLYTHLDPPNSKKNHLQMGKDLDLLNLISNERYYLKGEAAVLELGAQFYFNTKLRSNNFSQFSNPDFVKSLIVEGCGKDHTDPKDSFILHHNDDSKVNIDSRLHLTGGASVYSFFAYYCKNVLYPKMLPLKHFSMGRQYTPASTSEKNLFNTCQSSVVDVFGATKTSEDLDKCLEEFIEIFKNSYKELGYHFRLVLLPAEKLSAWESLRVSLEMYSTSLQNYIEVGNISVSGDFISKRLMSTYTDNKQSKFLHVLSGTIFDTPKFLGCLLEQEGDFRVPDAFKVDNWTRL